MSIHAAPSLAGIEILVHNISHSDLVLNINNKTRSLPPDAAIARPKFSHFRSITEKLLSKIQNPDANDYYGEIPVSYYPLYNSKKTQTPSGRSYEMVMHNNALGESIETKIAVGFNLRSDPLPIDDITSLRFRKDDLNLCLRNNADLVTSDLPENSPPTNNCFIDAAYFPLMAVLLPKWLNTISNPSNKRKIVVLISG